MRLILGGDGSVWFGYSTISGWTRWEKHKQVRRVRSVFGLYKKGRG